MRKNTTKEHTHTLYVQEENRAEWTHLWKTAKQNLTDKTGEAKSEQHMQETHTETGLRHVNFIWRLEINRHEDTSEKRIKHR